MILDLFLGMELCNKVAARDAPIAITLPRDVWFAYKMDAAAGENLAPEQEECHPAASD